MLNVIGQGLNTLDRLTVVERDRDSWQRAPEIIAQLNPRNGSRIADLGCGSGYFALKLASAVGPNGTVQAVDILRLPLTFLFIRGMQRDLPNLHVIHGDSDDPHISGPVDAVLVANTWHELEHPTTTLRYLSQALVPTGRLVIADRAPQTAEAAHSINPAVVESQLTRENFHIISRDDHFLTQPNEGEWFLIVAEKSPNPAHAELIMRHIR